MALAISEVQENIRKLRKTIKTLGKRPAPEDVHKLRTRARRFLAAVDALSLNSEGRLRRLLRCLARIRKQAGRVRDMDVLTAHLSTVRATAEQDCLVQLFEYLGAERYRHAARLRRLTKKHGVVIRKDLKRMSAVVEKLARKRAPESESAAPQEVAGRTLGLLSDLARPGTLGQKNLHGYRLKIKDLRYVLQMSNNARQEPLVNHLGRSKDAIGEWHDWEELIGLANEILERGKSPRLLAVLKTISTRKYDEALLVTNRMRKAYIGIRGRSRKRISSSHGELAQPALKAVSAIAA